MVISIHPTGTDSPHILRWVEPQSGREHEPLHVMAAFCMASILGWVVRDED